MLSSSLKVFTCLLAKSGGIGGERDVGRTNEGTPADLAR